jgi:hypothetical protein
VPVRRALLAVTAIRLLAASSAEARTTLPSLFARQIHAINAARHAPAVLNACFVAAFSAGPR